MTFRYIFRKLFIPFTRRNFTMESDEDMLYYSHQKLKGLIQDRGDEKAAICEYLKDLKYQQIKDFPKGLEWFNVSQPLSFTNHLKGKIVVLDFFTYCCINCMHIIPELRDIEQEFPIEDGLVVIGVHSAKFENEKLSSNILSAVQRYNITHPVVNDHDCQMWRNCGVHCWPTLLILGPNANPLVMLMGEGHKDNLRVYIKAFLDYYKSKNEISNHDLPLESAYHLLPDLKGPLLFPGKVSIFNETLAISDSGNHRILITNTEGRILHEIGGSKVGFKDGGFDVAEFNSPQGLCFKDEGVLFVADTENHAIRRIDLNKKIVDTIAGTGVQGHDRCGGEKGRKQEISSPWDVCVYRTPDMDLSFYPDNNPPIREVLLIAMAGTHQIWALFLEDTVWWKCKKYSAGTCMAIAGSGREENKNNAYPQNAGFAQPSGLAISQERKELFIADSESSSIRRLSLIDGKVTLVVGGDRNPNNLFAFGDKDGVLFEAKLQHALGVALFKDNLFVADTYNHKLKVVEIAENKITTILTPNSRSNLFNEPAGLCICSSGKIYLADTNNHVIKVIEVNKKFAIKSILNLKLTSAPQLSKKEDTTKLKTLQTSEIKISPQGGKLILTVNLNFVDGLKLNKESPQSWRIDLPGAVWSAAPSSGADMKNIDVVVSVPNEPDGFLDFIFNLITCTDSTCLLKKFVVKIPIKSTADAPTKVTNNVDVEVGTELKIV